MERRAIILISCIVAATLMVGVVSFAAVPQTISYQGFLADSGGLPVNGTVQMQFRLYSVETGTSIPFWIELWAETHQNVQVSQGRYSVVLGNGSPTPVPINLPFNVPYYLDNQPGSDDTADPTALIEGGSIVIHKK